MEPVDHTIINLIIFVLAIYVGLPRGLDRHSGCTRPDGGDQCDLGHRHRRRHAGRGIDERPGLAKAAGVLAGHWRR